MDEQTATDQLEAIVGSVDRCFRLMKIFQAAQSTASMRNYNLRAKINDVEKIFRQRAIAEGYSNDAVDHYLNHIR